MAQSPIRVDTNIVGTKRLFSQNSDDDAEPSVAAEEQESLGIPGLPAFLNLPLPAIGRKFQDLEWLERTRIMEGEMANDPNHRWAIESDPEIKARNRYTNIQAWANSRIHLKVPDGQCDFINASPITLKDSKTGQDTRYIATQGPRDGIHLTHFWQMVFDETKEVAVIVMLTRTVEGGREKCAQYYPVDLDNPTMELPTPLTKPSEDGESSEETSPASPGKVDLLEYEFDESCRSEVRKMELTIGSESKTVWHYMFAGWPDFSRPEGDDRKALIELLHVTASKSTLDNPRIIHCSAGVGRTGTFIALDHLLRELDSGELLKDRGSDPDVDPVFDTVNSLREQRVHMVYNEMQLQFVYEVLREQSMLKLGISYEHLPAELRSPKVARLSDDDYVPASKPELETVIVSPITSDKESE
ncbi:hypothetical protein VTN31DRAFT_5519 [Thermomyces dupontii]|uniref:uncharacterized protein n=1 Tax=Talaromyces thermophilus TaxID=28565 RepID=UPI0037445C8B